MPNVIIAGGRRFNTPEARTILHDRCDKLLALIGGEWVVLCGMARGADLLGYNWAMDRGLRVKEYPADWDQYGKVAGFRRNIEMARDAQLLIAFWDGQSRGTAHMIDRATEYGVETFITHYTEAQINPGVIARRLS